MLDLLRAILAMVRWIGIPALGGLGLLIMVLVADHFDEVQLKKDNGYMKPKVTRLWIERHPEATIEEQFPPTDK